MKIKQRYIWSPECGGCMMLQKFVDDEWKDSDSICEGEYPVKPKQAQVQWYNLQLKIEAAKFTATRAHQKWAMKQSHVDRLLAKQAALKVNP